MAWVNAIIQGILTGGLYALFACGLSLMFGVMKVVNLAHGDLAVIGAYVALGVITVTHIPALWSFVIVVPIMAVFGYGLQRTLIQAALDRSVLITLLVTFGLSVVIESGLLQFINADSHSLGVGESIITGSFSIGSQIQLSYLLLLIFAVAVVVLLGLQYFLSAVPVRPDDPGRGRRPGGGPAVRHRLPARVRHRGGDRVRHGGAGRHRVRHVLAVLADHRHRHDPAVRVRRGGDRRPRLAVGHAARRHRARHGPADRRADQPGPTRSWPAYLVFLLVLAVRPQGLTTRRAQS
jgi:Branched-chain amino acid ABC-type transport system, permease components